MFDVDRLISECRAACTGAGGLVAVREIVAPAVSAPRDVVQALGEPQRAGVNVLHHAPELTVLHLLWGPRMIQVPHDYAMWAVIGIYTVREDNVFWRRLPKDSPRSIEAARE